MADDSTPDLVEPLLQSFGPSLARENARLRARLAEVEAERDQWREELTASEKWRHDTALEREYFKARLAEVEAELDELRGNADSLFAQGIAHWNRAQAAEAALARVEAECVQWNQFRDPNIDRVVGGIRAALRGPQDEGRCRLDSRGQVVTYPYRASWDHDNGVGYIDLNGDDTVPAHRQEQRAGTLIFDYDDTGALIGVEVLDEVFHQEDR